MLPITFLSTLGFFAASASAHYAMTYPYWRGDSFKTQWEYPCGGVNQTESDKNRTLWPLEGGAIAFEPSHPWAQTYINLGLGANVTRLNIALVEPFNQTYNGTFCFPKVSMPKDVPVKDGDKATIQIIQLGHSGSALYNCADIEFSKNAKNPSKDVCFNSTDPQTGASELDYGAREESSGASSTGSATGASSTSAAGLSFRDMTGGMASVILAASIVAGFMV
ncbi:hypothetical protein EDC01DRAFT_613327 [Geopyxis carbonaria]|nr:hypothetical protein EDC01DRAFT_613327 [Geopyxis carbonaria]